jgi:hypothetical protein
MPFVQAAPQTARAAYRRSWWLWRCTDGTAFRLDTSCGVNPPLLAKFAAKFLNLPDGWGPARYPM